MLRFEPVDTPDHALLPVVRQLFEEYWTELNVDVCFQGFSEELNTLPGKYAPPRGVLFVVFKEDHAVACGALRELDEQTCELKRIFIRPAHRGTGLGRKITVDLMQHGRENGYKLVRLDTLRCLTPARTLYKSLGFQEIPPYNDAGNNDVVYYERNL